MTIHELERQCSHILRGWDASIEGIPSPFVGVRLGQLFVEAEVPDTMRTSRIQRLVLRDSAAQTREGIHPGSTIQSLTSAYGRGKLIEGECVLYAEYPIGFTFLLHWDNDPFDCNLADIAEKNEWTKLPASTKVREIALFKSSR